MGKTLENQRISFYSFLFRMRFQFSKMKIVIFFLIIFLKINYLTAQILSTEELNRQKTYTSFDAASKEAQTVFKLELRNEKNIPSNLKIFNRLQQLYILGDNKDSLPADIQFPENLQLLIIDSRKIIHFPMSLTRLANLEYLF